MYAMVQATGGKPHTELSAGIGAKGPGDASAEKPSGTAQAAGKAAPVKLDAIDRRILRGLQRDASLTIAEIANEAGLSPTPCWKRIQRLEQTGVIRKRVALLDQDMLGFGTTVFVSIQLGEHTEAEINRFATAVRGMAEVTGFFRMAGDIDYLVVVVVPDMASYDDVYRRIIAAGSLKNVVARFALERLKNETALPIL